MYCVCIRTKYMHTFCLLSGRRQPQITFYNYRVIQILRTATDGCRSQPWLAGRLPHGASNCRCSQILTLFFSSVSKLLVTRIDVHLQNGDVSIYWLLLLLDISAVSVVIVIIAICDMPRQEYSLREHVYIHNTYMKRRKSCSRTRRKFRIKFPGRPVPNPSTISRQAKRFKETFDVMFLKKKH